MCVLYILAQLPSFLAAHVVQIFLPFCLCKHYLALLWCKVFVSFHNHRHVDDRHVLVASNINCNTNEKMMFVYHGNSTVSFIVHSFCDVIVVLLSTMVQTTQMLVRHPPILLTPTIQTAF